MSPSVLIRPARPEAADIVVDLAWAFGTFGRPDRAVALDQFAKLIADNHRIVVVADDHDHLVGYATAQDFGPGLRCDFTTGRLTDLYVEPGSRRSGTGKALFDAVTRWARSRPFPMVLDWQASPQVTSF